MLFLQRKGQREILDGERDLFRVVVETEQVDLAHNGLNTTFQFTYP